MQFCSKNTRNKCVGIGWQCELCFVAFAIVNWITLNEVVTIDLSVIHYDVIECDWFTIIKELSFHQNQHVLSVEKLGVGRCFLSSVKWHLLCSLFSLSLSLLPTHLLCCVSWFFFLECIQCLYSMQYAVRIQDMSICQITLLMLLCAAFLLSFFLSAFFPISIFLCQWAVIQVAVTVANFDRLYIPAHLNRCANHVKKSKHFVYTLPPVWHKEFTIAIPNPNWTKPAHQRASKKNTNTKWQQQQRQKPKKNIHQQQKITLSCSVCAHVQETAAILSQSSRVLYSLWRTATRENTDL